MSRYQIAAYLNIVIGLAAVAIYGTGHYIQRAYAYQIANGIPTNIQEGSYWMVMDPQPFLYPGVALVIIGMAMVFYSVNKQLSAQESVETKP